MRVANAVGAAGDDGEEIVEIVGNPSREDAHRLHLLGLPQLRFDLLALGSDRASTAMRAATPAKTIGVVDDLGDDDGAIVPALPGRAPSFAGRLGLVRDALRLLLVGGGRGRAISGARSSSSLNP